MFAVISVFNIRKYDKIVNTFFNFVALLSN